MLLIASLLIGCGPSSGDPKLESEFEFNSVGVAGKLPDGQLLLRLRYDSSLFGPDGKPRSEYKSRTILVSWTADGSSGVVPLALVDDIVSPVTCSHRTAPAIWVHNLFRGEAIIEKPYEHVRREDFTPPKYQLREFEQSPDGHLAVARSFGQLYLLSSKADWKPLLGQQIDVHSFNWNHDNTLIALTDSGDVVTIAFDPDSLSVQSVETHQQGTNAKRALGRVGKIVATAIDAGEKYYYKLLLNGKESGITMRGTGTPLPSEEALIVSQSEAVHVIFSDGQLRTVPIEESVYFTAWIETGRTAIGIGAGRVWSLEIRDGRDISVVEVGTVSDLIRPESFIQSEE